MKKPEKLWYCPTCKIHLMPYKYTIERHLKSKQHKLNCGVKEDE